MEASIDRTRALVEAGIAISSELSFEAVLQKLVEPQVTPHSARVFGDKRWVAKFDERCAASVIAFLRVGSMSEGQPAYASLIDWTLDPEPGNAAEFERTRKEIFELRKQYVPGFVANGLGRLLGHPRRYQVVQFYRTMDAFRSAVLGSPIPQIQAYIEAHPNSKYASTPVSGDTYEVVRQV